MAAMTAARPDRLALVDPLDAPEWALVFVIALAPSVLAPLGRALTGQVWVA